MNIKEKLLEIAKDEGWYNDSEDFNVDDYAGGNIDDAYCGGFRDGQINLARELLELLKND